MIATNNERQNKEVALAKRVCRNAARDQKVAPSCVLSTRSRGSRRCDGRINCPLLGGLCAFSTSKAGGRWPRPRAWPGIAHGTLGAADQQ